MKRFLMPVFLLITIVTVFVALVLTSSASVTTNAFSDVVNNTWYTESVYNAFDHGYMQGTADGKFEPETPLTRGMLVTILANMNGADTDSYAGRNSFSDVKSSSWYHDAVEWAKANGIVNGTSATTFTPKANITAQDLCVMLYNYARFSGYSTASTGNLNNYTDGWQTSNYARTATQWAIGYKMIGDGTSKINPKGNATRALVAYMLRRFDETVGHKWNTPIVLTSRTCTTNGSIKWVCKDCGKTVIATTKAWHNWYTTPYEYKSASDYCTAVYHCKNDWSHTYTKQIAHSWILITSDKAGYNRYQCKQCYGTYYSLAPVFVDIYGKWCQTWSGRPNMEVTKSGNITYVKIHWSDGVGSGWELSLSGMWNSNTNSMLFTNCICVGYGCWKNDKCSGCSGKMYYDGTYLRFEMYNSNKFCHTLSNLELEKMLY